MRMVLLIAATMALAGCASPSKTESWVEGNISVADAQSLADTVVRIAKQRLPPASSTITLAPTGTAASPLPEMIADGLRTSGFALAPLEPTDKAHQLRFMVSPFEGQMLLRVTVDSMTTAQIFAANANGQLVPVSPQSAQKAVGP
ncbi:MAG: hypothetical protein H7Y60_10135 [Rhodospirillaceae bacterium]|nr:hypothetical protein [Rhodospirillales bacterium]